MKDKLKIQTTKSSRLMMFCLIFPLFVSCVNQGQNDQSTDLRNPNVIFILVDDLGYGDLGCYGQELIKTPFIDKMASEGMRFTDHYAGSTVCAPSRASLMTGLHTGHARVRGNAQVPLLPEDLTVAEKMKEAGYATALIGKWGLGEDGSTGTPNNQGFDYFFGYLNQIHAHNSYPAYLWKNDEKVQLDNEVSIIPESYAKGIGGVSTNKKTHSHDLFTKEALNFIEENKDTSFYMYLAYTIPHANNEAWYFKTNGCEAPDTTLYQETDWTSPNRAQAGMITYMDKDIGRILQMLKDLSIDKNTLVIFTSDNGPHEEGGNDPAFFDANGPLRGMKRDLYEGGIRVPMIAWWPGTIKPASTSDHISSFWDLMPTACDIAQIPSPENTDGISFLPELLGEKQLEHEYLYWEFHERGGKQAVRIGDWKGVRLNMANNSAAPIELYNLKTDQSEELDIADENPEIVQRISSIMNQAHTYSKEFSFEYE